MPSRYALLVLLGAAAGLRQGEAFGLALDRIDTPASLITVDQQVIVVERRPILASPKTSASFREVPMPTFLHAAIIAHSAQLGLKGDDVFAELSEVGCCAATTTTGKSGSPPWWPPDCQVMSRFMIFVIHSPAPPLLKACRSLRFHAGLATGQSRRLSISTVILSPRPAAGHVTRSIARLPVSGRISELSLVAGGAQKPRDQPVDGFDRMAVQDGHQEWRSCPDHLSRPVGFPFLRVRAADLDSAVGPVQNAQGTRAPSPRCGAGCAAAGLAARH